jgi:hypothetical protein
MTGASAPLEGNAVPPRVTVSAIDWGTVIAGALFAAALSFVFVTFGSAIGLSITSAWPDSGASAKWTLSLAAFWILAQQIGAFLAGGYLAGRLRKDAGPRSSETEFRDGIHGGLVWALGIAIGALLALSAASVVARVGAEAGRAAASAAPAVSDQMSYFTDVLLRPTQPSGQQPAGQPPSAQTQPPSEATRAELTRILARSAVNREMSPADKNYLASLVSRQTGLSPDDAQRRISETFAQLEQSTRDATDKARRAAALGGFITAASIVIGFAAAWWGAMRGGHHRDNNFAHSGFYLRSRPQM